MSLADLLTQTTPEWVAGSRYPECLSTWQGTVGSHRRMASAADATLAALAPDLAKLAIDMAAELRRHSSEEGHDYINHAKADALLARFAALDQRATTGGPAVNAIERLREALTDAALWNDPDEEYLAALAAVDALYQAAKDVVDYSNPVGIDEIVRRKDALAAAVRRIEGDQ